MVFHDTPLYEFNRFAPWELFCSAYRACHEAASSKSPLERIHHNRSMLLFTFAGIEASLNYMVQRLAAASGEDRSKFIRQKRIEDKLEYIEDKIRQQIDRSELDGLVEEYEFLRHEIVHHKRTDFFNCSASAYLSPHTASSLIGLQDGITPVLAATGAIFF
jgi:hypothetical protein